MSMLLLTSCGPEQKQSYSINETNWRNYCSFSFKWLGIVNKQPDCRVTFYVDNNYRVASTGFVSGHTYYNLHYWGGSTQYPVRLRVDFNGYFSSCQTDLDYIAGVKNVPTEWYLDNVEDPIIDSISGTIER